MILDTCFLVDLYREIARVRPGPAKAWLQTRRSIPLRISLVTWMEFAEGFEAAQQASCLEFLSEFILATPDVETAWIASRLARQLEGEGNSIGDHDVWIAAAALQLDEPLLTRNLKHFSRAAGIKVETY